MKTSATPAPRSTRHGAGEEPECNNERDLPGEGGDDIPLAGPESVAGEEDPGAALDTPGGAP